jgi:hypothetical protein
MPLWPIILPALSRNMEVPIMMRMLAPDEDVEVFNLPLARWTVGVLGMIIAVVGKETLLGLILRQTRTEIACLIRDEQGTARYSGHGLFHNN